MFCHIVVVLSIDKCQYMQIGYTDTSIQYKYWYSLAVSFNKDLGFIINSTLKPSSQVTSIIKNTNAGCKLIMKCFYSRDSFMLTRAYKTCVRPLLENRSPAWCPCGIGVKCAIESVQRSFTCKV